MAFLLKKVLMVPSPPDPVRLLVLCVIYGLTRAQDEMDLDEEWMDDSAVPPSLNAKIQALKVCRNRCLAHASTDTALDVSTPVLRMFLTLLECGGSFSAEAVDEYALPSPETLYSGNGICSLKVKSRLRLQAAISLLHLSTVEAYANSIAPNFVTLALTVQVSASI